MGWCRCQEKGGKKKVVGVPSPDERKRGGNDSAQQRRRREEIIQTFRLDSDEGGKGTMIAQEGKRKKRRLWGDNLVSNGRE